MYEIIEHETIKNENGLFGGHSTNNSRERKFGALGFYLKNRPKRKHNKLMFIQRTTKYHKAVFFSL